MGGQRRAEDEQPDNGQGQTERDGFATLPPVLSVPEDDGAAASLAGMRVPNLPLPATSGQEIDLAEVSRGSRVVVYCYPLTSRPGITLPLD